MRQSYLIICFMAFICLGVNNSVYAQSSVEDELIAEKLTQLNGYMSFISNRERPLEVRNLYAKKALSLFVNNGENYMINDQPIRGSLVEITSKHHSRKKLMLVKNYLRRLTTSTYDLMNINAVTVIVISKEKLKLHNDKYFVTCYPKTIYFNGRSSIKESISLCLDKDYLDANMNDSSILVSLIDILGEEKGHH